MEVASKEITALRKASGVCIRCGKINDRLPKGTCVACAEYAKKRRQTPKYKEYMKEYHGTPEYKEWRINFVQGMIDEGKCPACARPRIAGDTEHYACMRCREPHYFRFTWK
jgi:molybdenum cofactor biosynthesis enzyme MoaA